MDIGIPILIYITYVCLLCLQFLLVTLDSVFTGFYCLLIIEYLLEPLLSTGRLRIFLFSFQKSSYRCLLPSLYYFMLWNTSLYIYKIDSELYDRITSSNGGFSAILV